jgi:hypothetical protein
MGIRTPVIAVEGRCPGLDRGQALNGVRVLLDEVDQERRLGIWLRPAQFSSVRTLVRRYAANTGREMRRFSRMLTSSSGVRTGASLYSTGCVRRVTLPFLALTRARGCEGGREQQRRTDRNPDDQQDAGKKPAHRQSITLPGLRPWIYQRKVYTMPGLICSAAMVLPPTVVNVLPTAIAPKPCRPRRRVYLTREWPLVRLLPAEPRPSPTRT